MAWIQQRGQKFRICFRYDGRLHGKALKTDSLRAAEDCRARLEDTLNRVERGWLTVPDEADLMTFLLSGGTQTGRPVGTDAGVAATPKPPTVGELCTAYLTAQEAALEPASLKTLRIHLNHLQTTLGARTSTPAVRLADLQRHVDRRRRQKGRRGQPILGYTIRKEVNSLAAAWKWGRAAGLEVGQLPVAGLKYPRSGEPPRFQTRAEIERQIERGGLEPAEAAELWTGLFLTLEEVAGILAAIQAYDGPAFLYPMACFAAHTGARRSEMLRSRRADIDLDAGVAVIREKKRVQGVSTTRRVALSPFLVGVLKDWFTRHPGGPFTFCQHGWGSRGRTNEPPTSVSPNEAQDHLRRSLAGGPWSVIRGWHVFRHSFISNCAARGVDQRLIDAWVGHSTEAMRRRYRHLLPDQSAAAIRTVFGEG